MYQTQDHLKRVCLEAKLRELAELEEKHGLLGTSIQPKNLSDPYKASTESVVDYVLASTKRAVEIFEDLRTGTLTIPLAHFDNE